MSSYSRISNETNIYIPHCNPYGSFWNRLEGLWLEMSSFLLLKFNETNRLLFLLFIDYTIRIHRKSNNLKFIWINSWMILMILLLIGYLSVVFKIYLKITDASKRIDLIPIVYLPDHYSSSKMNWKSENLFHLFWQLSPN